MDAYLSNASTHQKAEKEAFSAGCSESEEDVQSVVQTTIEDESHDQLGDEAPLLDDHASGVDDNSLTPPKQIVKSDTRSNDYPPLVQCLNVKVIKEIEPPVSDQNDIVRRWAERGDDKAEIIDICNKWCLFIENKYPGDILHVWPAYDSKSNIHFVVTTKEDSKHVDFDFQYSAVVRRANTYSKEANVVAETIETKKITLSFEDSEKIKSVITRRAEELFKNHRYLSVISGNGIRSRGFSKGKHEIIQEICIVLYVQTKGKIPLDETEFPKVLDYIPVDVIEGEFKTCVFSTQYQSDLRMGCQIQSGNGFGTLGGFVEHPKYGLSALTCAHVVLDNDELHHLQGEGEMSWNSSTKVVYQPDRAEEEKNKFGQVREASYKSGVRDKPGMDLAVIQVESRPPIDGIVPDSAKVVGAKVVGDKMDFKTGHARFSLCENNNYVEKFGRTTEVTTGFVKFSNAAVKRIDHVHRYQLPDGVYTYRLFNQFEIRSPNGRFVDGGDSGSLVLKKDVSGDLVCIGMVVGHILPSGNGIVTPISAILSELGVNGFKDFRFNTQSTIENRLSRIETTLAEINRRIP